jgi:hypothetical protein
MATENADLKYNDPEDYVPYPVVDICGNVLRDVKYIIELKGVHPILIGKGKIPYIWLRSPSRDFLKWNYMVERSTAVHPAVNISRPGPGRMSVLISGKNVLDIVKYEQDSIQISSIDLRPIGLNVFGSGDTLQVGGMEFTKNEMQNGRAFIALG